MAHLVGKDIYGKLGEKLDKMTVRTPWTPALHEILIALYSPFEAKIIVNMPYSLSPLSHISQVTKVPEKKLKPVLEKLCEKGLLLDLWIKGTYHYILSPMIIGIFEFTMMRTNGQVNHLKWAKLFKEYLSEDDTFFSANFKNGEKISVMRALPWEESIETTDYIQVLDYERASEIINGHTQFAIGICSCRHEKLHTGEKRCQTPLHMCSSMGSSAEYLTRHGLAQSVTKSRMLENLFQAKELGLMVNADNVQKDVTFFCLCCSCCCHAIQGINHFGFPNIIVTSNYIAHIHETLCNGCGKCVKKCPIGAIEKSPQKTGKRVPKVDQSICLGCGVCALSCTSSKKRTNSHPFSPQKALCLVPRENRVIHPKTTFERIILQTLERGTLQYQMFGDPKKLSHIFMRHFIGGFLKLSPVKKALMSDLFRSRFLALMGAGIS